MTTHPSDATRKPVSNIPVTSQEAKAGSRLMVVPLEDRVVPAGQVIGTVFLDANANGLLDAAGTLANNGNGSTSVPGDGGVGGVIVTAYDSANVAQGATTTAANGTYTLIMGGTGPYRLEFTSLPTGLFYGPQAAGAAAVQSGTGVQFVPNGNTANINLSVVRPGTITADNPLIVTSEYRFGDRAGVASSQATIVSFPYSAGTQASDTDVTALTPYANPTTHQIAVTHGQVGATWGLAFDGGSNRVFAAAFTKRHVGYGPNGPGAIYGIDMPTAANPTVTTANLFVDLNALTGNAAGGADFRGGGGAGYSYFTDRVVSTGVPGGYSDTAGWNAVGKTGLGGLAVDATGTYLYTVGLADRRLYRVRIPADGTAPTAGDVTSFAIPLPTGASGVTGIGGIGGLLGDLRPFAVEIHNGVVYVGAVNSAESTGLASDLRAFVFAFDPTAAAGAGAFVTLGGAVTTNQAVLTFQLDYARGYAHPGDTNPPTPGTLIPGEWNAWTGTPTTLADIAGGERYGIYPQPELTGLAFDDSGNITLGLRDRAGDQFGNFLTTDFPGTPAPGTKGTSAGDTLRAFINTPGNPSAGWTLESNGNGTGGAGNGEGPGGGEFYFRDNLPPNSKPVDDHKELSVGSVLQLPGRNQVLVTQFDVIPVAGEYDSGGVRWFDTTTGTLTKAYRLYQAGDSNTFAKSNGLGDLIAASPVGREIGNRVWNDANGNGRQDPGEAGIQNVNVTLVLVNGGVTTTLATVLTDANGDYYFSSYSGSSTASKRFGVSQLGVIPPVGSSYEIRIAVADPALATLQVAPFHGTGTNTQNDSDGIVSGANYVLQNVATQPNGTAQHTNDVGFLLANASLSGFVYEDTSPTNTFDLPGDTPIAGVTVVLTGTDAGGGAITPLTTTTAANGSYSFTNLAPGTYTVTETQPVGYLNRGEQFGSTGGTATQNGTVISAIPLAAGQASVSNNFGEVRPVQLSGFVYHDINNDGTFNGGDAAISGVTVTLTGTDDLGTVIAPQTANTAANGSYSFTGLRPGTYTVTETQPPVFIDRSNNPGTLFTPGTGTAGTAAAVSGGAIQTIVLNSNANNPNNNFGEVLPTTSSLSGFVYEDTSPTNTFDLPGDTPIAGVTVVLTGTLTAGGGAITPQTTTTAANGSYSFTNLAPGTYTVTETQPVGYLNRGEQFGSTGGTATQNGTVISAIPLAAGQASVSNNFGEVRPVQLSGNVYHDINNDGTFNAGDALIPNVTLTLTGTTDLGTPVSITQVSPTGAYAFTGLRPGTYTVTETQPPNYLDRSNNPGTVFTPGTGTAGTAAAVAGGAIQNVVLRTNANNPNNNFGEILGEAQLSGYVYRDPNLNGLREPANGDEPGLGGVTVKLFREDGAGVLTQLRQANTDRNGFYSFTGLQPGTYRLVETQPVGLYSTKDAAGTTGGTAPGNDTIITIPLAGGQNSRNNNFGEVPRTNLFGYVWVDANRSGTFDPGETPIPGAVVTIGGTAYASSTIAQPLTAGLARGSLIAVTDSNGRWDFLSLPPGTYALNQTNTPAGYQDFRSQNASNQAVQTSTAVSFGGVSAVNPATGPLNFGKVSDGTTTTGEPSKQNFLGSSVLTSTGSANPLVSAPTVAVNTTPAFAIGTADPSVPALVAVGAGAGFSPVVRVFDYAAQTERFRFQAFENGMTAGVRVATGDVNGDGTPDIIATVGPGGGPRIRVFDGTTGTPIRDFYAYPPAFRGGLYVAAADFNGDGKADIVTGAGEGGGPNVRVFDGATGTLLTSFYAFDSSQTGGARVAVGDFNGDGRPDIAASNGPGNTSLIRVFSGNGFGQISQFTPYSATYTGGVFLAAGDLDGDGKAELVTGADQGGGPNVRTFNATTGQLRNSFFAYESSFTGGVRVTVRDITGDGKADIITGAGLGGASRIRVFSGATLLPVEEFYAFDSGVRTGIYLG